MSGEEEEPEILLNSSSLLHLAVFYVFASNSIPRYNVIKIGGCQVQLIGRHVLGESFTALDNL
jgi:hypothetical protein